MEVKKMIDILTAFEQGKTIEYQMYFKQWMDYPYYSREIPTDRWGVVKSEEDLLCLIKQGAPLRIKLEPKLRPYKNKAEFMADLKKHGPYVEVHWGNQWRFAIVEDITNDAFTDGNGIHYQFKFLDHDEIRWQNGAPLGILEE